MSAKKPRIVVRCGECEVQFETTERRLSEGRGKFCSRSCGNRATSRRHGHTTQSSQSRSYNTWATMIQRCNNPKAPNYGRYGGVGVGVCDEWLDFSVFLSEMGERPEGTTIDRINSELGYFKANCRWATPEEQQLHLRSHRYVFYGGKKYYLTQLARRLQLDVSTLKRRIKNWPEDRWAETPQPTRQYVKRPLGRSGARPSAD